MSREITPGDLAALDQYDAALDELVARVNSGLFAHLEGDESAAQRATDHLVAYVATLDDRGVFRLAVHAIVRLVEARHKMQLLREHLDGMHQ